MNILLISPQGFPINNETRYAGIEQLVWLYSREIVKEHKVSVWGHPDSVFPEGVNLYSIERLPKVDAEVRTFQAFSFMLRQYDVIHDFSHLHLASRFLPNLPSLNLFWHAPQYAKYPKAPYNIVALSEWAVREFKRVYQQEAKYQYSIGIDTSKYKLSDKPRNDRFFSIGRMGPEKGNLNSALLCKHLGLPLDIQGARGLENAPDSPLTEYEQAVLNLCDGEQIRYLGDLPEDEKIDRMQTCKALLYVTDHAEVTSHKLQECLLCGAPAVYPNLGAGPELIKHGVNGWLCNNEAEYVTAMLNIEKLKPMEAYDGCVERFSIENTVKNYYMTYEAVANGERW